MRLWLHSSWRTLERVIFSRSSHSSLIYRLPLSSLLTPLPAYRTQLLHPVSLHLLPQGDSSFTQLLLHINRVFSFLQPPAHYTRRRPIITQRKIPFEQLIWSMDLETYLLFESQGHARVIPWTNVSLALPELTLKCANGVLFFWLMKRAEEACLTY